LDSEADTLRGKLKALLRHVELCLEKNVPESKLLRGLILELRKLLGEDT